jgi:hypothetical protein
MAEEDTDPAKPKPDRHVYGPRPIGALVPTLTRPVFRSHSAAAAQVMLDWPAIVGPMLAQVTQPRRLSDRTLTIACAGPVAMELQHMALELVTRINTHLGPNTVRSLRFLQVGAFPQPIVPPRPPPRAVAAAEAAVGNMPEGDLRAALVALGSAVMAGHKPSTRRPPNR